MCGQGGMPRVGPGRRDVTQITHTHTHPLFLASGQTAEDCRHLRLTADRDESRAPVKRLTAAVSGGSCRKPAPHQGRTSWHGARRCTTPSSCRRDCQSGRRPLYPAEASMPLSFGRDPNAPGVLLSQLPELLLSCRMLMKLLTSVLSTVNVAGFAVAGSPRR